MTRPYRCLNCSEYPETYDFYAEEGPKVACPKCGITLKEYPEQIQSLVLIHFDPPHKTLKNRGQRHWACDSSKPITHTHPSSGLVHGGSGHAPAVTCPDCRETEAYKKAVANCNEAAWKPSNEKEEAAEENIESSESAEKSESERV